MTRENPYEVAERVVNVLGSVLMWVMFGAAALAGLVVAWVLWGWWTVLFVPLGLIAMIVAGALFWAAVGFCEWWWQRLKSNWDENHEKGRS